VQEFEQLSKSYGNDLSTHCLKGVTTFTSLEKFFYRREPLSNRRWAKKELRETSSKR